MARWSIDKKVHVEVATLQTIISGMNSVPFNGLDIAISWSAEFILRTALKLSARANAKYIPHSNTLI